jgi:tRNA(Ile)-lysidine synthase
MPSPPGTLLLSLRGLLPIHGDLVRTALVLRVMRYVSFYPWGSIRADGNRRKKMREQILDRLWSSNPFKNGKGLFVAGGGVLWTPVLVKGTKIKTPERVAKVGAERGEVVAWLASRQPPMHKSKMAELEIINPLRIDLTEMLKHTLEDMSDISNASTPEILYDCRFLVRFDIAKIPLWIYNDLRNPENPVRISIVPNTRWYWPEIILEKEDESQVLHSDIGPYEQLHPFLRRFDSRVYNRYWRRQDKPVASDWIHVEWVRPLSAI